MRRPRPGERAMDGERFREAVVARLLAPGSSTRTRPPGPAAVAAPWAGLGAAGQAAAVNAVGGGKQAAERGERRRQREVVADSGHNLTAVPLGSRAI